MQGYNIENEGNQVFQLYPNLGELDKDSGNGIKYPNVGSLNVYNNFQYNEQNRLRNEFEVQDGVRRGEVDAGFHYVSPMYYPNNGLRNDYGLRNEGSSEAANFGCNNASSIYPQLPQIDLNKEKYYLGEEIIQKKTEKNQYSSFVQPRNESFEGFVEKNGSAFRTTVDGYLGILDELRLDEEEKGKSVKLSENDDVLLCSITQEIMKDPVITPYGHCFERTAIEEWLGKNKVCPITGKPLDASQLIPCYPLKNIIQSLK